MNLPPVGTRVPFEGIGKRRGQRYTAEWHRSGAESPIPYMVFRSEKGRALYRPQLSMERIREYFLNLDREISE